MKNYIILFLFGFFNHYTFAAQFEDDFIEKLDDMRTLVTRTRDRLNNPQLNNNKSMAELKRSRNKIIREITQEMRFYKNKWNPHQENIYLNIEENESEKEKDYT